MGFRVGGGGGKAGVAEGWHPGADSHSDTRKGPDRGDPLSALLGDTRGALSAASEPSLRFLGSLATLRDRAWCKGQCRGLWGQRLHRGPADAWSCTEPGAAPMAPLTAALGWPGLHASFPGPSGRSQGGVLPAVLFPELQLWALKPRMPHSSCKDGETEAGEGRT